MTDEEAKKILALFRPGTADRKDPTFSEALERAKPNPPQERWQEKPDSELAHWFHAHCASHLSVRSKFAKIPVPVALKEEILAGRKREDAAAKVVWPAFFLRAAAVLVLCLGLAAVWWQSHGREDDFNTYRSRMARTALELYGMDLQSHDLQAINTYLASRKAPANYLLPKGVAKTQPVGCAVLQWQGAPVSMLCFHSGKPLTGSEKSDIWLFVVNQSPMRNGPGGNEPVLTQVKKLMTASWVQNGKMYVLAAAGDEAFLRKYF